ncbi:MrfA-like Zn-binding domain [Dillenia turbinata]|uniref:MrfA-like Zn-binding domain n=1 Tax=Dillenia turbinata TaxID=194707 RepID=A0AAN8V0D6_9MAGN
MEGRGTEIEVRTLTGESTIISISTNKTIQDLKLLLKQQFPPASTCPNFHLFHRGAKLRVQSQINSHSIGVGDFMVLVPFAKKDPVPNPDSNLFSVPLSAPNRASSSDFIESAWSEMMLDLSMARKSSSDGDRHNFESEIPSCGARNNVRNGASGESHFGLKGKRQFSGEENKRLPDELVLTILRTSRENLLEEENCKRFVELLESVNCLSDSQTGSCMLSEASSHNSNLSPALDNIEGALCMCPLWLKKMMKAFAFLNIFSASWQLNREQMTWSHVKEALNQLQRFKFQVGSEDVQQLCDICPEVVHISNKEMEGEKRGDAIIITNPTTEQTAELMTNPGISQKKVPISKVVSGMKKREKSFKTNVLRALQSLITKSSLRKEAVKFIALEDVLLAGEEVGRNSGQNEAKRARKSRSRGSSSNAVQKRCCESNQLTPEEMVEHLRKGIGYEGQIVHVEYIGPRKATWMEIPRELSEGTKTALHDIGITRLYSHQAESIRASLAGKNVLVATMTSSGKSLCYNLPVLELLSQNLSSCALYLFPTKALAQDQLRALLSMTKRLDVSLNIGVYDGDTSQENRYWLRDNGRLGAFGCHTALILRRLRRLCSHVYGSDPSFILCTATSANPREHSMELANLQTLDLINNDGSPSAPKSFILWNPPLCLRNVFKKNSQGPEKNVIVKRSSPIMEVSCLFAEMVQHGLRCIAFCKTRKICELVLSYTREILQETAPSLVYSICAYRAGYIAEDRRRIERNFFGGKLRGIAATNALELGIDVGHIDVTLHLGFPGSIASLWQQAGRSGRRERASLAVYVAFEGPLDQYFMRYPQKLFRSPVECCHIDSQNQQVLEQHLVCASIEHPLSLLYDEEYFGSGMSSAVMALKSRGLLSFDPSQDVSSRIWCYSGHEKMPAHSISIRAIETEKYNVIDKQSNELLEEIEESRAFFQVYEGAVYMNQGKTYLVKELNLATKIALCREADLKYYTKTRDYTDIHVIGGDIAYPASVSNIKLSRTTAQTHTCKVTTTWFGFRRIWRGSNQVFDTVELSLPEYSYESQAVWIRVPQSIKTAVEIHNISFRGGLHAACHAVLNVVPLFIICDASDLSPECANPHDGRYIPERILLYDQHAGGNGLSKQIQPLFTELLTAALELLTSCHCSGDTGCPNCIQNLACHEYNEVLHKEAAIMIIQGVLDVEQSYFKGESDCSSN